MLRRVIFPFKKKLRVAWAECTALVAAVVFALGQSAPVAAAEIPDTYERMSAVYFDGKQRFSLVPIDKTLKIDAFYKPNMEAANAGWTHRIFMGWNASVTPTQHFWIYSRNTSNMVGLSLTFGSVSIGNSSITTAVDAITRVVLDLPAGKFSVNGAELYTVPTNLPSSPTAEMTLFLGGSTPVDQVYMGHVYVVKISKGGTLTHDMVAVKRRSDGVCGFWNYVTGTFMQPSGGTGLGTGPLTCKTFDQEPWKI